MRRAVAPAGLALLAALLTALVTVPLVPGWAEGTRPVLVGSAWLAFAAALVLVRRVPEQLAVRLVLAGGVAMTLGAALVPPAGSADVYRYLWDGRVQAAGIDPYEYPPAAAALVPLRDPSLWPADGPWCVADGEQSDGEPLAAGCTVIDRPAEATIYPPVAQAYFRFMHEFSPAGSPARPLQLAGALLAIATTLVLLRSARARGADPRWVIAWAWCPAVALEAANNAHVDALAVLLTGVAMLCVRHKGGDRWLVAGGGLLGLAVATKITPLLVLPALTKRRPAVVALMVPLVILVLYVPHVLRVGTDFLGHLSAYLTGQRYTEGTRFALLTLLVPPEWAGIVAAAILVAVAMLVVRTAEVERPWLGAATMIGAALLVVTPGYPWYGLLLALMVGLGARTVWLSVVAVGYLPGLAPLLHVDGTVLQRLGYGAALASIVATEVITRRWGGRTRPPGPADTTGPSTSTEPAGS